MRKKHLYLLISLLLIVLMEKLLVYSVMNKIKKNDYYIESVINENKETLYRNKVNLFCDIRSFWMYKYSLCFRFPIRHGEVQSEQLRPDDIIHYDFIPPRSITSLSRISWGNNNYLNYKSPEGVPVGLIIGDGKWLLLDFRKGEQDKREQYNKPLVGNSNRVILKKGVWGE